MDAGTSRMIGRPLTLAVLAVCCLSCTGQGVLVEGTDTTWKPCNGDEVYLPTGPVVAEVSDCPPYPASCPYRCVAPVCAGEPGLLTCEPCLDLDVFDTTPGHGLCRWLRVDGGAISHACD